MTEEIIGTEETPEETAGASEETAGASEAAKPIGEILSYLLITEEEIDLDVVAGAAAEGMQRIVELAAGINGDPKNYSTKAAFRKDFKEARELTLVLRNTMAYIRRILLVLHAEKLNSIEAGNRPSLDKLEAQRLELDRKIARKKAAEGQKLSKAEAALLEDPTE